MVFFCVAWQYKSSFSFLHYAGVTNHCNLGCYHLAPGSMLTAIQWQRVLLILIKWQKVIDEVAPYVDSIGLTVWAKRFYIKKLEETLQYIKKKNKGIQNFYSTNAHIPGAEHYVERMAPWLNTVQIIH